MEASRPAAPVSDGWAGAKETQAELEAIYDNSPVMLCVLDGERRILYANRAFTSFTGVSQDELRAGRACGVFGCINALEDERGCGFGADCSRCELRLAIEDTRARGAAHRDVEYRSTLERDRSRREVVLLCATAPIGPGRTDRILLCMQDITERVRMQEALEESELRYRAIFENSTDGIVQCRPYGRLFTVNPACARIAGYSSPDEMLGEVTDVWRLFARLEDWQALREVLERDGAVKGQEVEIRRKDGTLAWISASARAVRDPDGKVVLLEGTFQDVTERKKAEETLRRQAELDRALAELYPPVVSPDTDLPAIARVVLELALRLTGSPHGFVSEVDPETGASVRHAVVAPPGSVASEKLLAVPVFAGDQLVGEIAVANAPVPYTEDDTRAVGRLAAFYGLGIQRKRAEDRVRALASSLEERVEERTAELLAANRELEAFSYSVSHDLRAPLRSVVGFGEAVLADAAELLPRESKEDLQRVVAGARRMSRLIDALLAFSRLTRREIRRRRLDLSALARETAEEVRSRYPGRTVEAVIEDGIEVYGDPDLVRIVLHSLLDNAWKFTSRTAGARVEVGSATDVQLPTGGTAEGRVLFVRDNGVGFDMAHAGNLFRPFHRLHSEADFPGAGIGLASAQRIVHRHGGAIWAVGAPGNGVTVYFTLGGPGT